MVLAVRDNGIGIPAEYHQAIFEMFRRVPDGDDEHAGSGMGLAIVKRIVDTHGGKVWVESTPGEGSVFRVQLPAGSSSDWDRANVNHDGASSRKYKEPD